MGSAISEHGGLRIACAATENGSAELVAMITAGPEPHDEIVEMGGVRVYLDPPSVPLVKDMVLDAETTEKGQVRFELSTHTNGLPG